MDYFGLGDEQREAFNSIASLLACGKHQQASKYTILDAPAGTGKTYTIRQLMNFMSVSGFSFTALAFTGRAATQLSKSGISARTCHSLLFKPIIDQNGNLIRFTERTLQEIREDTGDVIVVDEASMIPLDMHTQLTRIGVPIIYLGDYDQLPPVEKDKSVNFNPMNSLSDFPTFKLTVNHRFDDDSGIAELCRHLRRENSIPRMKRDDLKVISKSKAKKITYHQENEFDIIICGMNKTRKQFNNTVRQARGFYSETPEIGETIVCLRNDIVLGDKISNGEIYTVLSKYEELSSKDETSVTRYEIQSVDDEDKKLSIRVPDSCWVDEYCDRQDGDESTFQMFTFGYAVTCHKIQGSSIDKVLFFDEDVSFFLDQRRFRYTGCSRAAKELVVAI